MKQAYVYEEYLAVCDSSEEQRAVIVEAYVGGLGLQWYDFS